MLMLAESSSDRLLIGSTAVTLMVLVPVASLATTATQETVPVPPPDTFTVCSSGSEPEARLSPEGKVRVTVIAFCSAK
ncbi:hypothetical protein ES703_77255 [subsurface metagenome]